jgi:hypothetical protein
MKSPVYIVADWSSYEMQFRFRAQGWEPSNTGDTVAVTNGSFEFEAPSDADLRVRLAQQLNASKTAKQAELQIELNQIDEKIQSLLALEAPRHD